MELGMIGLGRMGINMVRRLLRAGHRCVVYDLKLADFADKVLSALRYEFGGHEEKTAAPEGGS